MTDDKDYVTTDSASAASLPVTRGLRLWPAVALVVLLWAVRIVPGMFEDMPVAALMLVFMGPAACGVLILAWWLFFSRAALREKLLGLLGVVIAGMVTANVADKSLQGFGSGDGTGMRATGSVSPSATKARS